MHVDHFHQSFFLEVMEAEYKIRKVWDLKYNTSIVGRAQHSYFAKYEDARLEQELLLDRDIAVETALNPTFVIEENDNPRTNEALFYLVKEAAIPLLPVQIQY